MVYISVCMLVRYVLLRVSGGYVSIDISLTNIFSKSMKDGKSNESFYYWKWF